ncbi:hypothetical protein [Serratia fonticola]|uniref:hypothetical protein n=1 Tax=Serratia fonticola TaxID=47917 RepID=UPI003AACD0B8
MNKLVEMIGNGDVAHFQKQAAHRIWEGDVVEAARKVVSCKSKIVRSVHTAALVELFRQEPEKP